MKGKHFIDGENWTTDELKIVLKLAAKMKENRFCSEWEKIIHNKTFVLMFFNPSLRTRLSLGTAISELGGHSQVITPESIWFDDNINDVPGEAPKDIINVISRYAIGMGLRVLLNKVTEHGEGNKFLQNLARYSDMPIISMADDSFHPCQAMADLMGWSEYLCRRDRSRYIENLEQKTLLLTWAHSPLIRPRSSVQSQLLMAARFGMNVRLARPNGYDLDKNIYTNVQEQCNIAGTKFEITDDCTASYDNCDIVYARNWISEDAYCDGFSLEKEKEASLRKPEWIVNEQKMSKTNVAAFANPMPIMRNFEATNAVIDSKNSILYEVAENRLHIHKALLSLIYGYTC